MPLPVEPHVDAAAQLEAARAALAAGDWLTAAAACIVAVPWYWWLQGDRMGARLLVKVLELRVGAPEADQGAEAPTAPRRVTAVGRAAPHVVLVGGIGRMGPLYADEAARQGVVLRHYERALPPVTVEPAAVLVIASCVAHPQRERAEEIGRKARCPVRYLDRPSRGALAEALAALRRSA